MADLLTQGGAALPAHIAAAFGGSMVNSDLTAGVSVGYPIVSYKGKTWQVVENGERVLVTAENGEDPAPAINAVIIRANPNLNKVYYPDGYEEGSTEKPLCHSNDSIAPAMDAQEPQAKKCAVCPFNQWGSKITESGARGKACSDSRRLAIAPEGDLERVMLLRVPAASLKTLLGYAQNLEKRGVPYQALVTRIGFDHTVAYPSLTFKAERWLDEVEVNDVKALYESDLVANITALSVGHAEVEDAAPAEDDFLPPGGPPQAAAPAAAAPKAVAPKRQAVKPSEVAAILDAEPPAQAAPPKGTGFGAKKTTAAAAQVAAQAAPAAAPATVLAEGAMADLDAALAGFDDAPAGDEG